MVVESQMKFPRRREAVFPRSSQKNARIRSPREVGKYRRLAKFILESPRFDKLGGNLMANLLKAIAAMNLAANLLNYTSLHGLLTAPLTKKCDPLGDTATATKAPRVKQKV